MADVFGFIQTVMKEAAGDKKFIIKTWTDPLDKLGRWVTKPGESQLIWIPHPATKTDVVEHVYGKCVKYTISLKSAPYKGKEILIGDKFRISLEEKKYSAIDRDYLYDVIVNRHRLGLLGKEGEKWYQKSLPQPVDSIPPPFREKELKKRSPPEPIQKSGWTLPGYNFCGPKNTLGYLPTSMLDAFCQYHDMEYAYRPSSLEIDDDRTFKHMLKHWALASQGDGFSGPTVFERNIVIPMILAAFEYKSIATQPWAKLLIPDTVLKYMTNFKIYAENYKDDWPDWKKLEWAKQNPHTAAEAMLEELYKNANYRKGNQLTAVDTETVALETYWNRISLTTPEKTPEFIKRWKKSEQHKSDTSYDGELVQGMVIFQFIPSGPNEGSFIMNYIGKDKIFPIYFVQDQQRIPNFVIPFSKSPSDIHPTEKIPYGEYWNKQSFKLNKDAQIPYASFEPILKKWSVPEDISLQHVDEYEREAKAIYSTQEEVDLYIRKKKDAYIEETHLTIQPVVNDPFGGEAVRIDDPNEINSNPTEKATPSITEELTVNIKEEPTEVFGMGPSKRPREEGSGGENDGALGTSGELAKNDLSLNLGPPRNYISRKTVVIPFDRIIRNIHLNDFMALNSITMGTWKARTPLTKNQSSSFKIYDPHGYFRLVSASAIPLDIPSMGLDKHAIWELKNTNFTRLRFLGGKIEFNGFRFMENDVGEGEGLIANGMAINETVNRIFVKGSN